MILLTIVVFPALSKPLGCWVSLVQHHRSIAYSIKILISLSLSLALRKMDSIMQVLILDAFVRWECLIEEFLQSTYYDHVIVMFPDNIEVPGFTSRDGTMASVKSS